jgi:hypothetical protein
MRITMTNQSVIDYRVLINDSMYYIIKNILKKVEEYGIHGDNHFYITYRTNYKGVEAPLVLKKQYPEEITIVIQHNFKDLVVFDDYFQISLSFSNKYTKLVIPYRAITAFTDPSEAFELEFKHDLERPEHYKNALITNELESLGYDVNENEKEKEPNLTNNVISIDELRKSKNHKV